MSNELLLIISVVLYLGTFILLFKFFGKVGIFAWIIMGTIYSNVEVLMNVHAFGMNMSLGNVLFGSTFLATDVLSERYGKEYSKIGMRLGVIGTSTYILFSQFWLKFTPSSEDFVYGAMETLFTPVLRIAVVSVLVYYICQKIDIFLYHFIWAKTTAKSNSKDKYLWLRNNGSTCITQLVNSFLFTYLSFGSVNLGFIRFEALFDFSTVISIFLSSWLIMTIVAFVDTPFCYLCRKLKVNEIV